MVAKQWLDLMNSSRFLPENYFQKYEKKDKPLLEALRKFSDEFTSRGHSEATNRVYMSKLSQFKAFCEANNITTLRGFTKEKALKLNSDLAQTLAPATHRDTLNFVSQFVKFCCDVFEIDDWQPMSIIKKPKQVKRAKAFWTLEEINAILNAAPNKHYRLMWAIMAYAGLRYSEACSVTPLSFQSDKLRIIGKGNKEAFLPISNKLKNEIKLFGDITEIDFEKYKPKATELRALKKAVVASKINNIGEITNHRFRHSFASNLLRSNVNVKAVQQLMRHESADITLNIYSHLIQEDLQDAANAI